MDGLSLDATEKYYILLYTPVFIAGLCRIELSVLPIYQLVSYIVPTLEPTNE